MKAFQNNNIYDLLVFLLVSALCFGCLGGSLQVDRVLAILLFPLLLNKINNNGCRYARRIAKGLILVYIYMVLTFLWTPDQTEAIKEIIYYPIHFLLFLELIVFARFAQKPIVNLSRGWLIAVLLCSIVALWEINTGNHLSMAYDQGDTFNTGSVVLQHKSASVTFMNFNSYNTFLCFCFPWIFYVLLEKQMSFVEKLMACVAVIMAMLTVVINASRGAVLSQLIMFAVYFLFSKKSFFKTLFLVSLVLFAVFFIVRYGEEITSVFYARVTTTDTYSDGRFEIWENALMAFSKSLGFGVGIGGLQAAIDEFSHGGINVTHNLFLEVLVQYGVIVCGIFIVFIWRLFVNARKLEGNRKIILMMSFVAMPVYSIIDSTYLLSPPTYVLIATIFIFAKYELIRYNNPLLRETT